jgi:hypothetical protein
VNKKFSLAQRTPLKIGNPKESALFTQQNGADNSQQEIKPTQEIPVAAQAVR